MYNPTQEQLFANSLVAAGNSLLIEAGAGAAKSSSLRYFAQQNPNKNFLVLCFNSANAVESNEHPDKPDNIYYSTVHSVAYREVVDFNMRKKLQNYLQYTDIDTNKLLQANLASSAKDSKEEKEILVKLRGAMQDCITWYCRSDRTTLLQFAECFYNKHYGEGAKQLLDEDIIVKQSLILDEMQITKLAELTREYWLLLIDSSCDFKITHDVYLKLFQLRKHDIRYIFDKVNKTEIEIDVLCLDEAQDSNGVTVSIFENSTIGQKIVVGDEMQCLIEDSLVDGKPIQDIRVGDLVSSAVNGTIVKNKVTNISKKQATSRLITITTLSGKQLTSTAYHTHFAHYPDKTSDWVVYLMYKKDMGYRIGVSTDFRQRCKGEIADKIWVLKHFGADLIAARIYETTTSYNYKIPETIFKIVNRKGELPQYALNEIFNKVDTETGALQLLSDLGLDATLPHFLPIKYQSEQMNVTITLNGDSRNIHKPMHRYSVILPKKQAAAFKAAFPSYNVRSTCKADGSFRVEGSNSDLGVGYKLWRDIKSIFPDARLKELANIDSFESLEFFPAINLVKGMLILVEIDGKLILDKIIDISSEIRFCNVYDINVANAHNFIANGIVTHNCIYAWRGATGAMSMFPEYKVAYLTESFRFPQHIADMATTVLSKAGSSMKLRGSGTKTTMKNHAVLCRTNNTLISTIWFASEAGKKVYTNADLKELFSKLYHVNAVHFGQVPKYPNRSLKEIMKKEQLEEAMLISPEITKLVNTAAAIAKAGGGLANGINLLKRCLVDDINDADLIVSTIHKAKGMEWDEVTIADDFLTFREDDDEEEVVNAMWDDNVKTSLLYVAITRAKVKVNLPSYLESTFN